jgi:hypothetical protein
LQAARAQPKAPPPPPPRAAVLPPCPAGSERPSFDEPDFALIDTLFSLAEAHLFMQLVEVHDANPGVLPPGKSYADLYRRVAHHGRLGKGKNGGGGLVWWKCGGTAAAAVAEGCARRQAVNSGKANSPGQLWHSWHGFTCASSVLRW